MDAYWILAFCLLVLLVIALGAGLLEERIRAQELQTALNQAKARGAAVRRIVDERYPPGAPVQDDSGFSPMYSDRH